MAFAVRGAFAWRTSPPSSESASLLRLSTQALAGRGGLKQAKPSQLCGFPAVLRASTSGCWEPASTALLQITDAEPPRACSCRGGAGALTRQTRWGEGTAAHPGCRGSRSSRSACGVRASAAMCARCGDQCLQARALSQNITSTWWNRQAWSSCSAPPPLAAGGLQPYAGRGTCVLLLPASVSLLVGRHSLLLPAVCYYRSKYIAGAEKSRPQTCAASKAQRHSSGAALPA